MNNSAYTGIYIYIYIYVHRNCGIYSETFSPCRAPFSQVNGHNDATLRQAIVVYIPRHAGQIIFGASLA